MPKTSRRAQGAPPADRLGAAPSLASVAEPPPIPIARAGLATCLFALSFATVLFTLAIFKLLSFFIMPSLFFDLLFIGFPIGAFLGAAFFRVDLASFLKSLWWLQAVTLLSVAAVFVAKNFPYFDYLRAHLFNVEVLKLLLQMGTFTVLFLPFFAMYGLSEYIGYQLGRRVLGGRMRMVYALYLFGAAAAYAFFKLSVSGLGVARVLAIALACIGIAIFALARGRHRAFAAVELAAVALLLAAPALGIPGFSVDIESAFLEAYKGKGENSTYEFRTQLDARPAFRKWGRYSLCEILSSADGRAYFGFYNDFFQWEFAGELGFGERSLGMIPLSMSPPDARIAIIGAGGGRQVKYAHRIGRRDIVAIEIEPAVIEAVDRPEHLLDEFHRVYRADGVRVVAREARGFLEEREDRYDLIYLPSVGGYPQMMMEPGNLIRTHEAYVTLRERLTDRGVLAIWYPVDLDPKGILTEHYVRTLRALGMRTFAFANAQDDLILAYKDPLARPPAMSAMVPTFLDPPGPALPGPPQPGLLPRELVVADDPAFRPITDDRPFLAGNVRHILSESQVFELWAIVGGVLLAAGTVIVVALRRRGDPRIPGRSYSRVVGLTALIGANFLLLEHALVLALFQRTYIYYDSLMFGAVSFLVLSGLGSMLSTPRWRRVFGVAGLAAMAVILAAPQALSAAAVVALMAPVALAAGTYFPALFERAAGNPLAVFALDAIGAGLGTLLAVFVPIAWGFPAVFWIAAGVFLLTVIADARFHRGLGDAPRAT